MDINLSADTKSFIREIVGELDHRICLGIRMGLFGKDAGDNESILNGLNNISDSINDLNKNE